MGRFLHIAVAVFFLTLCVSSVGACAAPLELLTAEEAALPESKSFGFSAELRNDGPSISAPDVTVGPGRRSFPLGLGFAPKDGAAVDLSTLRLEVLKSTAIDITPRIKLYAGKTGVRIESVSLPPGFYRFRVAIGDVNGKFSEKEFSVKVSVTY